MCDPLGAAPARAAPNAAPPAARALPRRPAPRACHGRTLVPRHPLGAGFAPPPPPPARAGAAAAAEASTSGRPAAAAAEPPRLPGAQYDAAGRLMLKSLTLPQLEAWCASLGEPPSRALHLWRWMYADRRWISCVHDAPAEAVQNGFSARFRARLEPLATLDGGLTLVGDRTAADGTRKLVFKINAPGPAAGGLVDAVLIPVARRDGTVKTTLCVSSQAGCAQGCKFCFTGTLGLAGSLGAAQVVEQVVAARRLLFDEARAAGAAPPLGESFYLEPISNIVFMGQGEPLDNLSALLPALEILQHPLGLHFAAAKITVSTVGLVPQLRALAAAAPRVSVAVSLHAADDATRDAIVPVNRRPECRLTTALVPALEELFPADAAAPRHGHHVLIEYTLLGGVNDSVADAERLLALLARVRCKINLICFNAHAGTAYAASPPAAAQAFRDVLVRGGRVCTVRASRGDDEMAACGQLGSVAGTPRRGRAAGAGAAAPAPAQLCL